MKVALISDTHFGVRNDAPQFLDMTKKFLDNVFFPTIERQDIRQIVHLGDLLDRRKYVAFSTAHRMWEDFILKSLRMVDRFDLLLGNHDVVFRNTNEVNGPTEMLRGYESDQFRIYSEPSEVQMLDGTRVLYLPWINDQNREASLRAIEQSSSHICFGHLELDGFEMYRGQVMEGGMSPSLFSKFDVTCSGHFHTKSSRDSIHYLGSHGEFTWSDWNDARGFHIFDTETRELEFVVNPHTMFEKIHYEETGSVSQVLLPDIRDKHVKVIVHSRKNQELFEEFISRVESCNPIDVTPVDDHLNAGDVLDTNEIDESEDTLTIFRRVLESSDAGFDLNEMNAFIHTLYREALTCSS